MWRYVYPYLCFSSLEWRGSSVVSIHHANVLHCSLLCNPLVGMNTGKGEMTYCLTTPTKAPTPVTGSAVTGSAVARTPPKRQTGVSLSLDQITISTSSLCKDQGLLL